jgi:hypothetical protein
MAGSVTSERLCIRAARKAVSIICGGERLTRSPLVIGDEADRVTGAYQVAAVKTDG